MSKNTSQHITRRQGIQLSLGMLGAVLMTDGHSESRASTELLVPNVDRNAKSRFFSVEELALLGEVVETIIPTTDTPGARAAGVHGFLDQLMADWALPETQAEFRTLLREIDASAKARFGLHFLDLKPEQQFKTISSIDEAAYILGDAHSPYLPARDQRAHPFARFKGLIFLGYYHSETGATRELQFELVPGRYECCSALSSIERPWVGDIWEDYYAFPQILAS